jgi:hypothetical protein
MKCNFTINFTAFEIDEHLDLLPDMAFKCGRGSGV